MNKNNKIDIIKHGLSKAASFITFEDRQVGRKKVYASLWAVFFGFFITSIIYVIIGRTGEHPEETGLFTFVTALFDNAFNPTLLPKFYLLIIILGFSGIAVSVSFKSGLFNIGIPSQMLLPAILFFSILIINRSPFEDGVSDSFLFSMFFVSIIIGMLAGAFSGFLKAFFNVHEVISTIFVNWIVVFLSAWLFRGQNNVFMEGAEKYNYFNEIEGTAGLFIEETTLTTFIIFGLTLFVVLIIFMTFVYKKTKLGYSLRMIGINKSNASYVGINQKLLTVGVMGFSGALAGIAGFYYYVLYISKIDGIKNVATIGFDSIAISLIGLNSAIGVGLTSIVFAIIKNGAIGFQFRPGSESLKPEFFGLITGLIVFMAALAILFYKFRPLRTTFKYSYLIFTREYWIKFFAYYKDKFKLIFSKKIKVTKTHLNEIKLKTLNRKARINFENEIALLINNSKDYNNEQILEMYSEISKKRQEFNASQESLGIGKYNEEKNRYQVAKSELKTEYTNFKETKYQNALQKNITSKFIQWIHSYEPERKAN